MTDLTGRLTTAIRKLFGGHFVRDNCEQILAVEVRSRSEKSRSDRDQQRHIHLASLA